MPSDDWSVSRPWMASRSLAYQILGGWGTNSKFEARNSNEARMSKSRMIQTTKFLNSNFEVVSDWSETDASLDIRISNSMVNDAVHC
jgi:hypothetical protein